MDVRVEVGVLTAGAEAIVAAVETVKVHSVEIISPVVVNFALAPVISVGGNSISAVNPEIFVGGELAVA